MYRWIIGLGNYPPSSANQFTQTRHNTGGDLVLGLMTLLQLTPRQQRGFLKAGEWSHPLGKTWLGIMPGYINLSGIGLRNIVGKQSLDQLLVVYDDVEIPYGTIRMKLGGSDKGHNGLRNITQVMGTKEYMRLRIGIGKQAPLHSYVLQKHSPEQWAVIQKGVSYCYESLEAILNKDFKDKKWLSVD